MHHHRSALDLPDHSFHSISHHARLSTVKLRGWPSKHRHLLSSTSVSWSSIHRVHTISTFPSTSLIASLSPTCYVQGCPRRTSSAQTSPLHLNVTSFICYTQCVLVPMVSLPSTGTHPILAGAAPLQPRRRRAVMPSCARAPLVPRSVYTESGSRLDQYASALCALLWRATGPRPTQPYKFHREKSFFHPRSWNNSNLGKIIKTV